MNAMPGPLFASSGNILADRRYDYAASSAQEGDHFAAADLLEQALELTPDWTAAWFALGEARERCGLPEQAAGAFARALASQPADPHGAALRLAVLDKTAAPVMSPAYVRALFDQYAPRFEAHLAALGYSGPQVLVAALHSACEQRRRPFQFESVLDLGCGTGLMARALTPHYAVMHGVDLSPGMLAEAARSGLYANLHVGDMQAWLEAQLPGSADLVLAADVLVYAGDLAPVFKAIRHVLAAGGQSLFAFTAQLYAGSGFALQKDMRFAHSPGYLRAVAQQVGLQLLSLSEVSTRRDAGQAVPGLACVLAPAASAA